MGRIRREKDWRKRKKSKNIFSLWKSVMELPFALIPSPLTNMIVENLPIFKTPFPYLLGSSPCMATWCLHFNHGAQDLEFPSLCNSRHSRSLFNSKWLKKNHLSWASLKGGSGRCWDMWDDGERVGAASQWSLGHTFPGSVARGLLQLPPASR